MSLFFYIVASRTKKVIKIDVESKGLHLSEKNGEGSNQLWRWASGGLLLSKSADLVIDVEGEKTNDGTPVNAWSRHGKLNQKWQIVEGRIQSCSGDDLNITGVANDTLAVCHARDDLQRWIFVPEALWDSYELCIANPNPLMNAMFLKTILFQHMDVILGCSFEKYEKYLKECVSINHECAKKLDEVANNVGIAKVAGGGAGIAGGTALLAGLFFAPFTGGLSIALTFGGAITAAAGALTSLGATIADHVYNKGEMKKVQPVVDVTVRVSLGLRSILLEICTKSDEANEFLQTAKGKSFLEDLDQFVKSGGEVVATSTFKIGSVALKGVTVARALRAMRAIQNMQALAAFIQADIYAVRAATAGAAQFAAAAGLKVPVLGRVLIAAGGAGAKLFSASLSVLGIVFGIYDVVSGAKQMQNGSELASELKKSADNIEKAGNDLIAIYKELS